MAFGTQFVKAGDRDRDQQEGPAIASRPPSAPESPTPEEGAASTRPLGRFGRLLGPAPAPAEPAPSADRLASRFGLRLNSVPPAPPAPAALHATATVQSGQRPVLATGPSHAPARPTSGSVRLDFLIERSVAHRRLDKAGEAKLRQEAALNPVEVAQRLEQDLKDSSAKAEKRVRDLQEGMARQPDSVVSLFIKGDRQELKAWPREKAGSLVLLHGATVESVEARRTPFPPPRLLRPAAPVEVAVVPDEGAFEAVSRPRI